VLNYCLRLFSTFPRFFESSLGPHPPLCFSYNRYSTPLFWQEAVFVDPGATPFMTVVGFLGFNRPCLQCFPFSTFPFRDSHFCPPMFPRPERRYFLSRLPLLRRRSSIVFSFLSGTFGADLLRFPRVPEQLSPFHL